MIRKEAENFIKQAESDLRNARFLFEKKSYDLVAFLSHQIAEKSIKAYIINNKKESPPKTHNLKEMGEVAEAPTNILLHLRDLTPYYITSRYPDAVGGVPAEIYTEETAERLLKKAVEVFEWVKQQF